MRSRPLGLLISAVVGVLAAPPAIVRLQADSPALLTLSPKARLAAIRRAQVWKPVDIGAMNLRVGPQGADAFEAEATVRCDFFDKEMSGRTPKFACVIKPDDELKVKYGAENGEVFAKVAATRLLWALGLPADRMYPVRVECRGCSPDPHRNHRATTEMVVFHPAAVERKMHGELMETRPDSGWSWRELDLIEESAGGAPQAHRDALKLLAVLIQHTDNKPAQQRLLCATAPAADAKDDDLCAEPWMMLQDLGVTFGRANLFNNGTTGSANFEKWSTTPVWAKGDRCVGNLAPSQTGTLDNPVIGESGRKFLADLLMQVSDAQLTDLFYVARFAQRKTDSVHAATTAQWVEAFKSKRDQIVNRSCIADATQTATP